MASNIEIPNLLGKKEFDKKEQQDLAQIKLNQRSRAFRKHRLAILLSSKDKDKQLKSNSQRSIPFQQKESDSRGITLDIARINKPVIKSSAVSPDDSRLFHKSATATKINGNEEDEIIQATVRRFSYPVKTLSSSFNSVDENGFHDKRKKHHQNKTTTSQQISSSRRNHRLGLLISAIAPEVTPRTNTATTATTNSTTNKISSSSVTRNLPATTQSESKSSHYFGIWNRLGLINTNTTKYR